MPEDGVGGRWQPRMGSLAPLGCSGSAGASPVPPSRDQPLALQGIPAHPQPLGLSLLCGWILEWHRAWPGCRVPSPWPPWWPSRAAQAMMVIGQQKPVPDPTGSYWGFSLCPFSV